MTLFDLLAILVILVSGAVGFIRGAAREVLTVLAFVIAVAIAVFGLRISGPIARHAIHPAVLANAAAIVVVFAVAYILIRIAGGGLTRRIQDAQALSLVDRVVGVAIGLVRALIMLGVFYLIFNWVTPAERTPAWIKDAALYPVSRTAGHVLMTLAPQGVVVADKVGPALEKAVREGSSDTAPAAPGGKGKSYDEGSRKTVDDLVEKTR